MGRTHGVSAASGGRTEQPNERQSSLGLGFGPLTNVSSSGKGNIHPKLMSSVPHLSGDPSTESIKAFVFKIGEESQKEMFA